MTFENAVEKENEGSKSGESFLVGIWDFELSLSDKKERLSFVGINRKKG